MSFLMPGSRQGDLHQVPLLSSSFRKREQFLSRTAVHQMPANRKRCLLESRSLSTVYIFTFSHLKNTIPRQSSGSLQGISDLTK